MSGRDWEALMQRHLDGIATSDEVAELSERLEDDAETRLLYLQLTRIHATLAADDLTPSQQESERRLADLTDRINSFHERRRLYRLVLSVASIAALVALVAGILFFRRPSDRQIATISAINGDVRWTGDGGHVSEDLETGQLLTGGTLELLSVDSSAAFGFHDGTTATISGASVLTISDDGQKELYLRRGNLSATVQAQPEGKPLRLVTPAAELTVRGTQFDVAASATRTKITVNQGLVRAIRLADRKVVDIQAAQSAVATIEAREPLVATEIEDPISVWKANLAEDKGEGEWVSAAHALRLEIGRAVEAGEVTREEIRHVYAERLANLQEDDGFLLASPMRTSRGGDVGVMYLVSLDVPPRQSGPIVLTEGNRFRIQGSVREAAKIKFGFSAVNRDRTGGARWLKSFAVDRVTESFDIELAIDAFPWTEGNGDSPLGRELVNVFCLTSSREAELVITNVELLAR